MSTAKKTIVLLLMLSGLLTTCTKDDDIPISTQRNDSGIVLDIPLTGSLQNPAFSPDDESIVFTRFINGYNKEPAELYTYNLTTKELKLLVADGSGNINLPGSVWNETTKKIIFSSTRGLHDEIYLIPENGTTGDEIKITDRPNHVAYEPTLSPTGDWTVFESHILDQEENGIIMKYKIDGSSAYIPLTANGEDCRQPNWSPANNKILYQKHANGHWDIWIMNTDGSSQFKVTSGNGDNTDASFSHDGQLIIYSTDFDLDMANIYSIPIQGGTPARLSNFDGYDGAPSIASDGKKIVFESINADPDNSTGTHLVLLNI